MINEYNEKKIRLTSDKILAIDNVFLNSNKSFSKQCKIDSKYNIDTKFLGPWVDYNIEIKQKSK